MQGIFNSEFLILWRSQRNDYQRTLNVIAANYILLLQSAVDNDKWIESDCETRVILLHGVESEGVRKGKGWEWAGRVPAISRLQYHLAIGGQGRLSAKESCKLIASNYLPVKQDAWLYIMCNVSFGSLLRYTDMDHYGKWARKRSRLTCEHTHWRIRTHRRM